MSQAFNSHSSSPVDSQAQVPLVHYPTPVLSIRAPLSNLDSMGYCLSLLSLCSLSFLFQPTKDLLFRTWVLDVRKSPQKRGLLEQLRPGTECSPTHLERSEVLEPLLYLDLQDHRELEKRKRNQLMWDKLILSFETNLFQKLDDLDDIISQISDMNMRHDRSAAQISRFDSCLFDSVVFREEHR